MIRDRAWGLKAFGESWEKFSFAVQNTNPHNPANGAYGHLVRCCQIAKGMGWGRDVIERGVLTLRPAVKWRSEWDSRVRERWLSNAWDKAKWHD